MNGVTSSEAMIDSFQALFNKKPRCFRAPGRINLIGEHTDYNEGFVLPAGIDACCQIAIEFSEEDKSSFVALDMNEHFVFKDLPLQKTDTRWANYLIGVIHAFYKRKVDVPHINLVVSSAIPIGAGLSSSAALESAMAVALNQLLQCGFSKMELTRIAKEAENEFVGLQCGIMDMFASIHAKKDHAMMLDCRSLDFEYVPLHMGANRILLFDTGVKHDLASSEYNTRRQECQHVVDSVIASGHSVHSLRDVTLEMLREVENLVGPVHAKRARFVIEENKRVHLFAAAMKKGDWALAGQQLWLSHDGLRDQYEVSCKELDVLVDLAGKQEGVWGGRMMGGGFGGCTINLVQEDRLDAVIEQVSTSYSKIFGIEPKYYIATAGDGACEI